MRLMIGLFLGVVFGIPALIVIVLVINALPSTRKIVNERAREERLLREAALKRAREELGQTE